MLYFKQNLQGSYYDIYKIKAWQVCFMVSLIFYLQISLSSIFVLLIINVVFANHQLKLFSISFNYVITAWKVFTMNKLDFLVNIIDAMFTDDDHLLT